MKISKHIGLDMVEAYELLEEVEQIQRDIDGIRASGIRASRGLDELYGRRAKGENLLAEFLEGGAQLSEDHQIDYLLSHFGKDSIFAKISDTYRKGALEIGKGLDEFLESVRDHRDEMILSEFGGIPREIGVLSGSYDFLRTSEVHKHKSLILPVTRYNTFSEDSGSWKLVVDNNGFFVSPEILTAKYEDLRVEGHFSPRTEWHTDKSGPIFGPGPSKKGRLHIYIGNDEVKRRMGRRIVIPQDPLIVNVQFPFSDKE